MNTRITSAIILSVALCASASSAPSKAVAYGSSKATVHRVLGVPNLKLSSDVFVYFNFHAEQKLADDHGCHSLMVTFKAGNVAELKLINSRAVTEIATELRTGSSGEPQQLAVNK